MTEVPPLVADYLQARAERDKAQDHLDEIQARLIKQMEQDQRKSFRWEDGGASRTVTYVAKKTAVVDEAGLRKALKAKVYDRYTKRVLDKKAMEAAMASGEVNQVTVSKYVTLKPIRPYLEYRVKEIEK